MEDEGSGFRVQVVGSRPDPDRAGSGFRVEG